MTVDQITEFANGASLIAGMLGGILLVIIFTLVWGYHKDD